MLSRAQLTSLGVSSPFPLRATAHTVPPTCPTNPPASSLLQSFVLRPLHPSCAEPHTDIRAPPCHTHPLFIPPSNLPLFFCSSQITGSFLTHLAVSAVSLVSASEGSLQRPHLPIPSALLAALRIVIADQCEHRDRTSTASGYLWDHRSLPSPGGWEPRGLGKPLLLCEQLEQGTW